MAESESAGLLKPGVEKRDASPYAQYGTQQHRPDKGASAFETVDWEFGAERDRLLREALQKSRQMRHRSRSKWRRMLSESVSAGQGWIVFLVVGFLTGVLAGMIQIAREWAFDLKFGYCQTGGFWNSRKECCRVSVDEDSCWHWRTWSEFLMGLPGSGKRDNGYSLDYLLYIVLCTVLGTWSAWLVKTFAPFASGSGIPEIKTILGGFVMKGYLGGRVLLIKSVALVLSIASGLSVGLEAAYVHIACCIANVVARYFSKYANSEVKRRELLSGAAAAGISVAFGAPVGGVLFSLEMLSSYFPPKTIWRSFYCAIVAAITLRGIDPLHSGKLVAFEITYHYAFGWFELPIFIALGAVGGLVGTLLLKLMVRHAYFRQSMRHLSIDPSIYRSIHRSIDLYVYVTCMNPRAHRARMNVQRSMRTGALRLFSAIDAGSPAPPVRGGHGVTAVGVADLPLHVSTHGHDRLAVGSLLGLQI